MKRLPTFLSFILCLSTMALAQPIAGTVQANNIKAVVQSNGVLFNDGQQGQFIPLQPGLAEKSLLRGAGLWIAGKDANGRITGALVVNGQSDFTPGSYDGYAGEKYPELNKVWKVTCADINQHVADFNDNGVVNNPNPNIYGFPGKGNPYFENLNHTSLPFTQQSTADFYDRDDDALYNPARGDYPAVELYGCPQYASQNTLHWFVSNDIAVHPSGLNTLKTEVQTQVLTFKSTNPSSLLNNALIVRYKILNLSDEKVDSCYMGLFADFDIGNPGDDFLGTIPDKNIMYGYNGDTDDENGFGQYIPVMAVELLRGPWDSVGQYVPLRHMMVFDNADNLQPQQYYNLLSGLFADGSPAPNNGIMFSGNPNDPNSDSEQAAGNTPGQRAGLISYGPSTLLPQTVDEMVVAYYYKYTPGLTPTVLVNQLYGGNTTINDLFDNCFQAPDLLCDAVLEAKDVYLDQSLSVYPNPASNSTVVEANEEQFTHIAVFDLLGRQVLLTNLASPVHQYTLSTGGLDNGVYFLQIDGVSRKLVVQR